MKSFYKKIENKYMSYVFEREDFDKIPDDEKIINFKIIRFFYTCIISGVLLNFFAAILNIILKRYVDGRPFSNSLNFFEIFWWIVKHTLVYGVVLGVIVFITFMLVRLWVMNKNKNKS